MQKRWGTTGKASPDTPRLWVPSSARVRTKANVSAELSGTANQRYSLSLSLESVSEDIGDRACKEAGKHRQQLGGGALVPLTRSFLPLSPGRGQSHAFRPLPAGAWQGVPSQRGRSSCCRLLPCAIEADGEIQLELSQSGSACLFLGTITRPVKWVLADQSVQSFCPHHVISVAPPLTPAFCFKSEDSISYRLRPALSQLQGGQSVGTSHSSLLSAQSECRVQVPRRRRGQPHELQFEEKTARTWGLSQPPTGRGQSRRQCTPSPVGAESRRNAVPQCLVAPVAWPAVRTFVPPAQSHRARREAGKYPPNEEKGQCVEAGADVTQRHEHSYNECAPYVQAEGRVNTLGRDMKKRERPTLNLCR